MSGASLAMRLDEMVSTAAAPSDNDTIKRDAPRDAFERIKAPAVTADRLRAMLRQPQTFDRIVDLFNKIDTDRSGEVDQKEFMGGVLTVIQGANPRDVANLFREFDSDKSGQISYTEMRETIQAANRRLLAPELPHNLMRRKRDVLQLYRQFEKGQLENDRARSVLLPTFEECLRMYYPKDPKKTIDTLSKWIEGTLAARMASSEAKTREKDEALIASLDADGSGTISLAECCELAKHFPGVSKVQMRARFRDKDYGNKGELYMEQMRELLEELRAEAKARDKRAAESNSIRKAAFAAAARVEEETRQRMHALGVEDS